VRATGLHLQALSSTIGGKRNDAARGDHFRLALHWKYPFTPVQILCKANGAVLFQRFQQRSKSGERHSGHVDHLNYTKFETIMSGLYINKAGG